MKIMNRFNPIRHGGRPGMLVALLSAVILAASIAMVAAGDTNSPPAQAGTVKPAKKAAKKKLTGAELYQINCNRCHAERYPTEFTSAQWKTIATHMRIRANIPAAQVREILKYLQEDSGN